MMQHYPCVTFMYMYFIDNVSSVAHSVLPGCRHFANRQKQKVLDFLQCLWHNYQMNRTTPMATLPGRFTPSSFIRPSSAI